MKKKLKLEQLKVESFVTAVTDTKVLRGGAESNGCPQSDFIACNTGLTDRLCRTLDLNCLLSVTC